MTKDVDLRNGNGASVARYTLAVNRRFHKDGEQSADFINCVSFGKTAEFAEKYFRKGMQVAISGRIQTGSYTNKDGNKIYTTDVVVEEQEFAESKVASQNNGSGSTPVSSDGFLDIPDGVDTQLPFN